MKITNICLVVLFMIIMASFAKSAKAADCIDFDADDAPSLSSVLADYSNPQYSSMAVDGENTMYTVKFCGILTDSLAKYEISTGDPSKHLIVRDLNVAGVTQSPYLKITGPNITLENVTLTGNGTGTAIQITATGSVTIQGTAAEKTVISGFTKGIEVANGGKLILGDNVIYGLDARCVSSFSSTADNLVS